MKFLIIDEMHPSLLPMLREIGLEYNYQPDISAQAVKHAIPLYDGVIVRSKVVMNEELLSAAKNLKYICRAGAGIDNLDVELIERKGIVIINAPEGNQNAVAEHCVGLLFALINNIVRSDRQVRSRIWDRVQNRGYEIRHKTVAIIGYGHMGSAFAAKLSPFGCRVIAYDKYKKNYSDEIVEEVSLQTVFDHADVVSLHLPLTNETKYFADQDFFDRFKNPIWLINTARGEVLSTEALIQSLRSEKVKGAALDVLENEKINALSEQENKRFDELIFTDNIIFTPHIAGWTYESYKVINTVIIEKLRKAIYQKRTQNPSKTFK